VSADKQQRNPFPTTDAVIAGPDGRVVLIFRKNEPHGWALPGGFVDVGEELGAACRREAREETGLDVELVEQLFTYSDPRRDPRKHTISTVYAWPVAGGSAAEGLRRRGGRQLVQRVRGAVERAVLRPREILRDYFRWTRTGERRRL